MVKLKAILKNSLSSVNTQCKLLNVYLMYIKPSSVSLIKNKALKWVLSMNFTDGPRILSIFWQMWVLSQII